MDARDAASTRWRRRAPTTCIDTENGYAFSCLRTTDMPQQTTAGPIFRLCRQRLTNELNDEAELSPWRTKEATPLPPFPPFA